MRVRVLAIVAIIVVSGTGFVGLRLWQYNRSRALKEGISALKAGDYQRALARLEPLAHGGNHHAQRVLGEMYARGLGVPIDEAQATTWFRRAECQCNVTGQFEYSLALDLSSYASHEGSDKALAVRWLRRAADAGHPAAQRLLADPGALEARGLNVDASITEHWRRALAR